MAEKNYMLQKNDSNKYLQLSEHETPEQPELIEELNEFLENCGGAIKSGNKGYLTLYYPFKTLITETVADSDTTHFDFTIDTDNDTFEGVMKSSSIEKVNSRIGAQYGQSRRFSINGTVGAIGLEITGKNHKSETVTETITSTVSGTTHNAVTTTNFYKEITSIKVSGSVEDGEKVILAFDVRFKLENFDYKYIKNNTANKVYHTQEISSPPTYLDITINNDSNDDSYFSFSATIGTPGRQFDNAINPIAIIEFLKK